MIKKVIFLTLLISMNFIFADCINLSKYPCINTKECKWRTVLEEQDCSFLYPSECSMNTNCFWDNSKSKCLGGIYSVDKSFCVDDNSMIDEFIHEAYDYVQSKTDQVFVDFLISNGFKKVEIDNEIFFKNDDTIISYDQIILGGSGVKFKNLNIKSEGRGDDFFVLKFDSISLNLSLTQLIYIFKDIANNRFNNMDSFNFDLRGAYLYLSKDDIDVFEVSLDKLNILFDGYLNNDLIQNMERKGVFPMSDQIFKVSLSGLKLHKIVDRRGYDMLNDPMVLFGFTDFSKLYEITSFNFDLDYKPSINIFKVDFKLFHPYFNSSSTISSKMKFSHDYKIENSSWTNNYINYSLNFISPSIKKLNVSNVRGTRDLGEFILTKIPTNINFNSTFKDDSDLVVLLESFNLLDEGNSYAQYNDSYLANVSSEYSLSADMRNFSFDVANVGENYKPDLSSYQVFDFNNFTTNAKLDNNLFVLNSIANSDMFNIYFNVMVDLFSGKINRFDIDLINANENINQYIEIIEREAGFDFIRTDNDIHVDISGYINDYKINGINFDKRYAQECNYYLNELFGMAKYYKSKIGIYPTDGKDMNDAFDGYLDYDIFDKWKFSIDIFDDGVSIFGTITAKSLPDMEGGPGKIIIYNVSTGELSGFGQ